MKKVMLSLVIAVAVVAAVLVLSKNTIARLSVEKGVELVTGLKMGLEEMDLGIMKTFVGMKGLKLYNPPDYEEALMAEVPDIYIYYDLPALMRGDIRLKKARIYLKEFTVVKNAAGDVNLNEIKVVQQESAPEGDRSRPSSDEAGPDMKIEELQLRIDRVVYKDYSGGGTPKVQVFDINIDDTYTDIDQPNELVKLIVVKALMNTTIARLVNFDLSVLKDSISGTLGTAKKVIGATAEKTGAALVKTSKEAGQVVQTTSQTVEKAAEGITGILKSPFGGGSKKE